MLLLSDDDDDDDDDEEEEEEEEEEEDEDKDEDKDEDEGEDVVVWTSARYWYAADQARTIWDVDVIDATICHQILLIPASDLHTYTIYILQQNFNQLYLYICYCYIVILQFSNPAPGPHSESRSLCGWFWQCHAPGRFESKLHLIGSLCPASYFNFPSAYPPWME